MTDKELEAIEERAARGDFRPTLFARPGRYCARCRNGTDACKCTREDFVRDGLLKPTDTDKLRAEASALIAEVRQLRKALAEQWQCGTNDEAKPQIGAWLCSECEGCEKTGHREGCLLR